MSDQPVAIVTGGASGIGLGIATMLITDGYDVFVLDNDLLHVDDYNASHPLSRARVCDVSDASAVATEIDGVLHVAGRIDLLVNNAGISGPTAPVEVVDPSEWQRTLDVSLTGAFNVTRSVAPVMKAQSSGVIINIASNAGLMGCPNRSPYVAVKWGLIGLTKTWAMELGPYKVRVNALCPASVDGERIEAVMARDAQERGVSVGEIRQSYERQSSLQSFTRVEDIASMVCYLASDAGARISGQAIGLDGHTETLGNFLGER
ncbi:MAG: 3-oxoacyl-[acyl-carrier-protein] reductase [SAR116 cluster bacterium]|jgi:NAD(P)-dependent dehydrogenase (short-subunit alcohol dehydrogenase family)|nr:3-oxoacyl-[acyl-carrier-protein] reductase [SAR116 cluster bacterium]